MIVTPVPPHAHDALAARLRARGWDPEQAADAAGGVEPAAFLFEGLDDDVLLLLVRQAGQLGLDCLTGTGWAVLAGSRARLGALARPWLLPLPLQPLANALGQAMPAPPDTAWRTARGVVRLDSPRVMAILNVTPDSFSDGGQLGDVAAALKIAAAALEAGAGLLDVGGESTRPGRAAELDADDERARVVPVISALAREFPHVPISIDTMKASVAEAALDAGAAIVNDVSGGRLDADMLSLIGRTGAGTVLMHSRGANLELSTYAHAEYADAPGTVLRELAATDQAARAIGVTPAQIVLDPGLGFAKTPSQTLAVLHELAGLGALGRPLLVGPSRKRFLGTVSGLPVHERDALTATACALAYERGARLFRVHAVAPTVAALALAAGLHSPERFADQT